MTSCSLLPTCSKMLPPDTLLQGAFAVLGSTCVRTAKPEGTHLTHSSPSGRSTVKGPWLAASTCCKPSLFWRLHGRSLTLTFRSSCCS